MNLTLKIERPEGTDKDFPMPSYQSSGAAGLDIRAHLPKEERARGYKLLPGRRSLISGGFKIQIPTGLEGQIRARSGLAKKYGITLANGIGTIDSDFRGVIGILLINHGPDPFTVNHTDRIAQLVIQPVIKVDCVLVESLIKTERGEGGFGSTGEN
tara:strand:- start:43 stop:510 length:468 start_codon:yes stop_codon:yes gene_type:complete